MKMYTSERIANIKDLEDIISRSYQISQMLSQELCVSPTDASKAKALSESLVRELNDAKNFEICVIKTESIWADEQSKVNREATSKIDTGSISSRLLEEEYAGIGWKPIEMGGLTSIYDEIQKDLDKIAESLLRTQEICDKSMRISERAINQSNKALILSLIFLGATALGIVAMVLIFLL